MGCNRKRPMWLRGLLWAESIVELFGWNEAVAVIDTRIDEDRLFGAYNDFDRGAEAYLKHIEGQPNAKL